MKRNRRRIIVGREDKSALNSMKKKVITLLLSLVLASGSIGNVQVLAADTTEQGAEPVQEEETNEQEEKPVQEEEPAEETDTENASEDVSEAEEEEEPAQENEVQVQEDEDFETEEAVDEEEADTSEDAAVDVLETEEAEITDESEDALADVVYSGNYSQFITWALTNDGTLTISGSGEMYDEADNTGGRWYSIARDHKIYKVIIEEGITKIGRCAFADLPDVETILIPDSVRQLGPYAFNCDRSLKSITIPDSVSYIDESTFQGCSSLTSITIPDSVAAINDYAFSGCSSLTSITIPDSMKYIYNGVFSGCSSLTSITIPNNVKEIGGWTFQGCSSLKSIKIPDRVKSIEYETFSGCTSLTNITIPNSVTKIGESAFENCSSLKSVTIPNGIIDIKKKAFVGCNSLTSMIIPNSVTKIGESAFEKCSNIESIIIPDGVTSIGADAFADCGSLEQVTLSRNIKTIGKGTFKNCDRLTAIVKNKYGLSYCRDNGIPYIDCSAIEIKLTSYNGSDIRVNISKREDASGYQIKYADNSNMTNAKSVMLKGSDKLSTVITGLKNGKIYYVKIQSYQTINGTTHWSNWSPAQSIKITQTPYNTNVSKLSTYVGSHIKVDWTKTAGASGYHIKYADNSSMTGAKEVFVMGNSTFTKTLTGLKNGKTYYVKMQTFRTASGKTYWSSWSPAKSIKVDQIPYGSSVKKLTWESSTKIKVNWDKAPSASGYHIQYSWYTDDDKRVTKDIIINGNGTVSKTITGLKKNTDYGVRIQTFRKIAGKTYWSSWSKNKYIYYVWK